MNYMAEFPIEANGVSKALIFIEQTLRAYRLQKRDLMEALLISEEAILMLIDHAPADASLQVTLTRQMGIPRIRLFLPGTAMTLDDHIGKISLDQLGDESETAIRGIMLRSYADSIRYRHTRSGNILTIITGIPERILATHTVSAIGLALITGLLMRFLLPAEAVSWLIANIFSPAEGLFISALMCITAPAVFVSIACSLFRFEGFSDLGRSGRTIIESFLLTSVAATLIGVLSFHLFRPGDIGVLVDLSGIGRSDTFSLLSILTGIIPPNIVEPFISVNSLQLMVTALTIGTAMMMSGKRVASLRTILEELDVLCGKVSSLVMRLVPIVVYCSTANVLLSSRAGVFLSTAELVLVLLAGLASMLVFYCLLLLVMARLNPLTFLRKYASTMKSTFLKGSCVAAIPMTLRVCRRQLGLPQSICSFSIPLGSTMNMDGNCVCLTIISLFFARTCGASLDANSIVVLLFLVLVLSLGAPIAPGTLILCTVTLLTQMGIDTSVVSLIIGINFILEMLLGMVNSVGNVVVSLIVARRDGTLDLNTYNKR